MGAALVSIVSLEEIAQFQVDAESMMYDTCTITRASTDPNATTPTTIYSGKCQFKVGGRYTSVTPEDTGTSTERDRVTCKIPVSATGVDFNDKVRCDSSINPSLVGDSFFVVGLFGQTAASAQRLVCERRLR